MLCHKSTALSEGDHLRCVREGGSEGRVQSPFYLQRRPGGGKDMVFLEDPPPHPHPHPPKPVWEEGRFPIDGRFLMKTFLPEC